MTSPETNNRSGNKATSASDSNSYRSILRGMSAFGSVQVFQIIINVVRGKCVALLLGPEGMGITQLLSSSTLTLKQIAALGLPMSIVREVAATEHRDAVIAAARKIVRVTALIGLLLCVALSGLLSRWTFDSDGYTWSYVALSVMVFFSLLSDGEMSLLQGLHQVKRLSKSSLVGASVGLLGGVPLYYFFGYKGIVPGLILLSVCTWGFYRINMHYAAPCHGIRIAWTVQWAIMKNLLALGIVLMAGSVLNSFVLYVVNMCVRAYGSVGDVGLFQAANTIAGQYVSIVFTALSLDYFPRLSAVASDNDKMNAIVNRQMELVILVIAPLSIILVMTAPILIRVLTSGEFMAVVPVVRWMALGLFVRAMAYPLGFVTFAKGNKRLYFYLEGIWGSVVIFVVNIACYLIWGLVGLGVAVAIIHAIDCIVYYLVNHHYYQYEVDRATLRLVVMLFIVVVAAFGATFIHSEILSVGVISCLLAVALAMSYRGIKVRLNT